MYLKVYKIDNEVLVAVCDEKYLGKEFSEGNAQLKISEKFYGRTPADCAEVTAALQDATIAKSRGRRERGLCHRRRSHRGGSHNIHRGSSACPDD